MPARGRRPAVASRGHRCAAQTTRFVLDRRDGTETAPLGAGLGKRLMAPAGLKGKNDGVTRRPIAGRPSPHGTFPGTRTWLRGVRLAAAGARRHQIAVSGSKVLRIARVVKLAARFC